LNKVLQVRIKVQKDSISKARLFQGIFLNNEGELLRMSSAFMREAFFVALFSQSVVGKTG
jgi:hypothetical protein